MKLFALERRISGGIITIILVTWDDVHSSFPWCTALYAGISSPCYCILIQCNYKPSLATALTKLSWLQSPGKILEKYFNTPPNIQKQSTLDQSIISYVSGDMGMDPNSQNHSQDPHHAQNNVSTFTFI